VVVGAPFLNVTKVLCGYWFGLLWGVAVALSMELLLSAFTALLFSRIINTQAMAHDLAPYLDNIHGWRYLLLLQLSSIPMHIRISVLSCEGITPAKFWGSFVAVSAVMTVKNALIGDLLFHERWVWAALAVGLALSLLPMLVFVYLLLHYQVYNSLLDYVLDRPNPDNAKPVYSIDGSDSEEEPWLEP
jgi:hypothetical protein